MSEYKRFVSYIYEYPDQKKGANRGFLKVECRGGFCQMIFSLRGICRDDNGTVKIYGFRRKDALLEGSLLADAEVTGGTLALQIRFPEGGIGDQKYAAKEVAGVILLGEEDLLYATQWDDDPLDFTGFPNIAPAEPEPQPEESVLQEAISPKPVQELTEEPSREQFIPKPPAADAVPKELVPDSSEPESALEDIIPNPSEPESSPKELIQISSEQESASEEAIQNPSEPESSPEETIQNPSEPESSPEELIRNPSEPESSSEELIPDLPAPEDDCGKSEPPEELHAAGREEDAAFPDPCFRDGRIVNCRQITRKDISRLDPADWYLSNNRFVLYGQQTFGHLLLGELAENSRPVLCVPGIYHQQERALAGMYGFTSFAPCPGHPNRPHGFGYWYRLIQTADLNQGNV